MLESVFIEQEHERLRVFPLAPLRPLVNYLALAPGAVHPAGAAGADERPHERAADVATDAGVERRKPNLHFFFRHALILESA
jgi:hypothetical protein